MLGNLGGDDETEPTGDVEHGCRIVARLTEMRLDEVDESDVGRAVEPGVGELALLGVDDDVVAGQEAGSAHAGSEPPGCDTQSEVGLHGDEEGGVHLSRGR